MAEGWMGKRLTTPTGRAGTVLHRVSQSCLSKAIRAVFYWIRISLYAFRFSQHHYCKTTFVKSIHSCNPWQTILDTDYHWLRWLFLFHDVIISICIICGICVGKTWTLMDTDFLVSRKDAKAQGQFEIAFRCTLYAFRCTIIVRRHLWNSIHSCKPCNSWQKTCWVGFMVSWLHWTRHISNAMH